MAVVSPPRPWPTYGTRFGTCRGMFQDNASPLRSISANQPGSCRVETFGGRQQLHAAATALTCRAPLTLVTEHSRDLRQFELMFLHVKQEITAVAHRIEVAPS